ncbi:hypothetical protein L1887_55182 [Cichorium endivia]|nr:hypothetical protein L1887_55182 [Cichorium endivia]
MWWLRCAHMHSYPSRGWQQKGWGRARFPTRLPGWGVGQTVCVPIIGSLFWALVYGTPRGMGWEEERTMPAASKWLFGRGHEGWCIEAEAVVLPPLPTSTTASHAMNGHAATNGVRKRHANGNGVDQLADATSLRTDEALSTAAPATAYDASKEAIPTDILTGDVAGTKVGVHPTQVAAFWQWKSVAAAVSRGKVISVKPGNDVAGIGSGVAASPSERMVMFFVGGGYHSGHAPQGPLSWTVCRQTSLRVLGVNFRKATSDARAFPAALQDALAAWVYVTKRLGFRPHNVILMGDSAGGGLAMALQLYLSARVWAKHDKPREGSLGRARKLVLPQSHVWRATTTCATSSHSPAAPPPQPRWESATSKPWRSGTISTPPSRPDQRGDEWNAELARLGAELSGTVAELGVFHPLFSPGLDARANAYLAKAASRRSRQELHARLDTPPPPPPPRCIVEIPVRKPMSFMPSRISVRLCCAWLVLDDHTESKVDR